jgi:hypothetical protein
VGDNRQEKPRFLNRAYICLRPRTDHLSGKVRQTTEFVTLRQVHKTATGSLVQQCEFECTTTLIQAIHDQKTLPHIHCLTLPTLSLEYDVQYRVKLPTSMSPETSLRLNRKHASEHGFDTLNGGFGCCREGRIEDWDESGSAIAKINGWICRVR